MKTINPLFRAVCLTLPLLITVPYVHAEEKKMPKPPIDFPPRHGYVTEYVPGKNGTDQVIVMIQDLHANVGVQRNIAKILFRLLKNNKLPRMIVCVEGASGEGDVSLLRSLPRGPRRLFNEFLLRKAYLTGAELAATETAADLIEQSPVWGHRMKEFFYGATGKPGPVTLSPIQLWGVDDPELYRKNWRAAKIVDKQRYAALQQLSATKEMLLPGANPVLRKHLGHVTKLLLLRLQPTEYYEYLENRHLTPRGAGVYQSTIEAAELYYEMAELRSGAMVDNVLKRMGNTPGYTALISGGFHTMEMAVQFKKRGYTYMVVTPDVKLLDQDPAYLSRLREEE